MRNYPVLVAQGRTVAERLEIAQDVAHKLVESYREQGDELPPAFKTAVPGMGEVRIPVAVS